MYKHETQVGGTHYDQGDLPQHWDLVVMYQWDYFQAQIIKYLMRWKTKHPTPEQRLEDLKKARSFLDKYISTEQERMGVVDRGPPANDYNSPARGGLFDSIFGAYPLPPKI